MRICTRTRACHQCSSAPRAPNTRVCIFATNRQALHLDMCLFLRNQQDHIGAAGFVYDHFTQDDHSPTIIASKRIRADLRGKDRRDPGSVFGTFFRLRQTFFPSLLLLTPAVCTHTYTHAHHPVKERFLPGRGYSGRHTGPSSPAPSCTGKISSND